MRKVFSLLMVTAVLLALLSGCGRFASSANSENLVYTGQDTNTSQENTGPVDVEIYYGNQAGDGFKTDTVTIDKLDPGLIGDQLVAHGVMPDTCYLDSCSLLHLDNGEVAIVLNFCNDFKLYLRNLDAQREHIVIGSVVNTFVKAYGVNKAFVLAKKDVIKTDHATYDDYLYPFSS